MSVEQDLLTLKAKGEKLGSLKIENATKLQMLEQDKEKLLAEAKELGIDPQKIEEILQAEETALQQEVTKLGDEVNRILDEISRV
jgi:hypothetical protein